MVKERSGREKHPSRMGYPINKIIKIGYKRSERIRKMWRERLASERRLCGKENRLVFLF